MKNPIVFFGTGPVSLATLQGMVEHFDFEAIVTKPAKVAISRAKKSQSVADWAIDQDIPLLEPATTDELKDLASTNWRSQVGVVADYGLIIPQALIDSFPLGIVNSHFSPLPRWRGPDPITAALLAGDSETGVSLMKIVQKLDEGPIFAQQKLVISQGDNIATLTEKLVSLSNKMIQTDLPNYASGELMPKPQAGEPTYSHKVQKSDGAIDWAKPAETLEREVRAYLGWPGSYAKLYGRDIIITQAHVEKMMGRPGEVRIDDKKLLVYCGRDALAIDKIKPAGKNEMPVAAFLAGVR